jgi:hypothetical protein
MKLTWNQRRALERILATHAGPAPRSLLPLADRKEDRVRQTCKRLGFAEYVGGWRGKRREPKGWQITPAGRAALSEGEKP